MGEWWNERGNNIAKKAPLSIDGPWQSLAMPGDVIGRVVPLTPCGDPRCICSEQRVYGVLAADAEDEAHGWVTIALSTEPDAVPEDLRHHSEMQERIVRLSILLGVPWEVMEISLVGVKNRQEDAAEKMPASYLEAPPEQLRRLRGAMNCGDPLEVCALLNMVTRWTTDPGGTCDPKL